MKAAVIVFPGSNCDRDLAVAIEQATGKAPLMVWHKDADFDEVDLIAVPGGFSYGDYLRCGAMSATSPVMREVVARANKGVATLGICNGFQILCEAGLLPGALMRNANLDFRCHDVHLRVENSQTAFTSRHAVGDVVKYTIAHHDGNYFVDTDTLARLEDQQQVALRYCAANGEVSETANPNGSLGNIAGVCNTAHNVLGMMPHPERMIDQKLGGTDGCALFAGLVEALS